MKKLWTMLMAAMCVGMTQAQKTSVALTSGGDMESENTCVMVRNAETGVQEMAVPEAGTGKNGTKGVSVTAQAGMDAAWNAGLFIVFNQAVYAEDEITVEFDYKATSPVTVRTQAHGEPGMYNYWKAIENLSFTEEWQHFSGTVKVSSDMEGANGMKSIAIFVGQDASDNALAVSTTFYLDNVVVTGQVEPSPISTGSCGTNVTWTFNSKTGLLKIEGTGEMKNFYGVNLPGGYYVTGAPWGEWRDKVTRVEVCPGVTSIGTHAFNFMDHIQSVQLPEGLTRLGEYCFRCTYALENIDLPSTLTTIDRTCFVFSGLKQVTIPEGITLLNNDLFDSSDYLTSVSLPSTLQVIGQNCFNYCIALKHIDIPAGVTEIGDKAFAHVPLKSLVLPKGLKKIGNYAFLGAEFESIVVPAGVESFGEKCFDYCRYLTKVKLEEGITALPVGMFYECNALEEITLPKSLESIGSQAFYANYNLNTINCLATTPPSVDTSVFSRYYDLYIPIGSKDAYAADPVWSQFNLIEKDFDEWVDTHIEGDVNGDGVVDKDDLDKLVEILLKLKIEN